ncbi:cation efflux protein [Chaetomidium leptoderma]|uniref:Cation efflux protein n=1 Tax=Chaetomidium leptoderma TaxID=669021 RepID=A0AAN6VL51_9PEZI|nr:cation efflux protein [Chaetomidium leptoderma]
MGWSKSTRIKVMLVIDIVFFLLELGVGFAVHSLALMADAFHMLNDIISLLVGLWAVSVASKATTDKFSYGWLRAEILGAFFNAVFLIALCVSIVLEALTRFLDPPEIGNAQLILVVGCLGLASNLAGFVVLGGHGHSHGPGEHEHGDHVHGHGDGHSHAHGADRAAEEGRAGQLADEEPDIFPEAAIARYRASGPETTSSRRERRTPGAARHGRLTSIGDMSIHPASFRQEIIDASRTQPDDESSSGSSSEDETAVVDGADLREDTPLLKSTGEPHVGNSSQSPSKRARRGSGVHHSHNHNKPKKSSKSHGHSHGDMGMNAMILHVIGDALGNVGVIITALVIWLTDWPGRFYADPAVSLFITLIILRSALPLTVAASKILLQATPEHIDLSDVREDIQALPGVISCHHVHIWQLSDTKVVASMHIQVSFPISEAGGERYMELSKMARKCLHAYGIHSATIQPEFCLDRAHDHAVEGADAAMRMDGASAAAEGSRCGSVQGDVCLLDCVDDCVGQGCCSPNAGSPSVSRPESSHSGHDHGDHQH